MDTLLVDNEPYVACPICGKSFYGIFENIDNDKKILLADGVKKIHCVCFECQRNFYYVLNHNVITLIAPE